MVSKEQELIDEKKCYEYKFWKECEYKPFTKTQHKCLRCNECTPTQYWFCYGLSQGVAAEKAKHEKFVEEVKSYVLSKLFKQKFSKPHFMRFIDKLQEKYK